MLADVVHQELDGKQRNHKGDHRAEQQESPLEAGDGSQTGLEDKLEDFIAAGSKHDRNRHKEGELGCHKSGAGKQHRAQDCGAGTGGAGDDCQQLQEADAQRSAPAQLFKGADARLYSAVAAFQQDEQDAVKDEGDGDDDRGVKMLGDPIVDQQTDDADRQHSDQHLCPQLEGGVTLCARFGRCKGIELVEVENHHRQDGAELDDHKEHIHKVFGLVEL